MTIDNKKELLKIVIVGHVDHGKSTLIGRLFHDTNSLPEGKLEQIQNQCKKRGMPFEYSFLLDALQAERDQGITIDTTQIWFKTQKRDYVIIDAPGHKEFLKNMVSGAAMSEAAVLVIDANEGVKEQSKRHGYLLSLLGVKQIAVAVNKMDLVDYSEEKFKAIEAEYTEYLKEIGVEANYIIPVSAREGDFIANNTDNMAWYKGPTIVEALDSFKELPELTEQPLRLPLQDVYKFDERRILVGKIESGQVNIGDELIFSPTNRTAKVASIEAWGVEKSNLPTNAYAGQSVGITLTEQIFAERGQVVSHVDDAPMLTNMFGAKVFWLYDEPLKVGNKYKLKLATAEYQAEVKEIERIVDTGDLSHTTAQTEVKKNDVAEVTFKVKGMAAVDDYADNSKTGRFVMLDGYNVAGGGTVSTKNFADQRVNKTIKSQNIKHEDYDIGRDERAIANNHKGGVMWFTGLSGSGKSTLARELQNRLFQKGYQVYVLDGDNIRSGLNSDLGFASEDRHENLRRVGEVASLFADSGTIVITAFISPYKADRDRARAVSPNDFHSIYIKADVDTCASRDPKGLYEKAKKGEIKNFTGISAPYEAPDNPDLELDTTKLEIEESVEKLVHYVEEQFVKPVRSLTKASDGSGI